VRHRDEILDAERVLYLPAEALGDDAAAAMSSTGVVRRRR